MTNKNYQETNLGFPVGFFYYFADSMGSFFQRINQFFVLVGLFISPTSFDLLGYTISDLTAFALILVVVAYAIAYIAISAMIYKIVSPFAGVG
jgi:hypothetical protein